MRESNTSTKELHYITLIIGNAELNNLLSDLDLSKFGFLHHDLGGEGQKLTYLRK
jgi:hypothetical protein